MTGSQVPARWMVVLALASVYLIWGSTYLGIRWAIETLPPFLMASTRFFVAGTLLYGLARWRGGEKPQHVHWRSAALTGALMILGGNGGVTWAEQRVPSGLAALLIGTVPLWIVVVNWLVFDGTRPNRRMTLGLATGVAGLALLIGPADLIGGSAVDPLGAGVVLLAALCWATGSLVSRRAPLPASPLLGTGMQMLMGGLLLVVAGTLTGEWAQLDLAGVSLRSALAVAYLAVFGTLIGFTSYIWLLRHTTPARAASYAYVNPVVAVLLGWAFAGEALSARVLLASGIIVGSVVMITSWRAQQATRPRTPDRALTVLADGAHSEAGAGT